MAGSQRAAQSDHAQGSTHQVNLSRAESVIDHTANRIAQNIHDAIHGVEYECERRGGILLWDTQVYQVHRCNEAQGKAYCGHDIERENHPA